MVGVWSGAAQYCSGVSSHKKADGVKNITHDKLAPLCDKWPLKNNEFFRFEHHKKKPVDKSIKEMTRRMSMTAKRIEGFL